MLLVGVDEVGRGAWAGPLVAAALTVVNADVFPFGAVRDSKLLSDAQRRRVLPLLERSCDIRYGIVSHRLIDRIGIQAANVLAIDMALQEFCDETYDVHSDYVASFHKLTSLAAPVQLHVRGESLFPEIAAASIAAKVFRDDIMIRLHGVLPTYGFAQHKGYGTKRHSDAIRDRGTSFVHRISFVH